MVNASKAGRLSLVFEYIGSFVIQVPCVTQVFADTSQYAERSLNIIEKPLMGQGEIACARGSEYILF